MLGDRRARSGELHPTAAIEAAYDLDEFNEPGRFDNMVEAIKQARARKTFRKTSEARAISSEFDRQMLEEHLDLAERLETVCSRIRRWNGLENR